MAGWKYDELITKLREKQKVKTTCNIILLFWDLSSADSDMFVFNQKIIRLSEDPMELQSWTESWKMKQQTTTPRPKIMYEAEQKPKLMRHFSIVFGGGVGKEV